MEFSNAQQQKIIRLFESLNNSEVQYVVPRGHQNLPSKTPGGDIDFIIRDNDFKMAIEIAKEKNYYPRATGRLKSVGELGKRAIEKPQMAVSRLYNSPQSVAKLIVERGSKNANKKGRGSVLDWRAYNDDIMVHFRNHLAYESPLRGGEYRVDPAVERQLFEYQRRSKHIYIPSPPDEMAHLICRGVFDKKGCFPEYYIDRCDYLFDNMTNGEIKRFKELLSYIFLKADELVYAHTTDGKYNDMLRSLQAYSDY